MTPEPMLPAPQTTICPRRRMRRSPCMRTHCARVSSEAAKPMKMPVITMPASISIIAMRDVAQVVAVRRHVAVAGGRHRRQHEIGGGEPVGAEGDRGNARFRPRIEQHRGDREAGHDPVDPPPARPPRQAPRPAAPYSPSIAVGRRGVVSARRAMVPWRTSRESPSMISARSGSTRSSIATRRESSEAARHRPRSSPPPRPRRPAARQSRSGGRSGSGNCRPRKQDGSSATAA